MENKKPGLCEKVKPALFNFMFPRMTKRRLRFTMKLWKYMAIIAGIGITILFVVAGIQTHDVWLAALVGPLAGAFAFALVLLEGKLWKKYMLPASLEMQGDDPKEIDPDLRIPSPTTAGRMAWRLFLAFAVVAGTLWYVGLGNKFLGTWGIVIAGIFSIAYALFMYWGYKRIRTRKQQDLSRQDGNQ